MRLGIGPTAICLFRQGDVDWLSIYQLHRVLLSNLSMRAVALHARKGEYLHTRFSVLCPVTSTAKALVLILYLYGSRPETLSCRIMHHLESLHLMGASSRVPIDKRPACIESCPHGPRQGICF